MDLDSILRAPQPQRQRPQEPMKEEYPNGSVGWAVETAPDGTRLMVVHIALPRKIMVFPIDALTADALGKKLCAPNVQLPGGNGGPPS